MAEVDNRPPCGHKYCPPERCGYMSDLYLRDKYPGIHGEGLGTGLPNDGDYSDLELKMLKFLNEEGRITCPECGGAGRIKNLLDEFEVCTDCLDGTILAPKENSDG